MEATEVADRDVFAEERAFYEGIKGKLLQENPGKFALIRGKKLVGLFDTDANAYREGVMKFGNVPLFIVRVEKEERRDWIPVLHLGLLDARL